MSKDGRGRAVRQAHRLTVTLILAMFVHTGIAQGWITSTGTSAASVALAGTAELGPSVRLRIGETTLTFDLTETGPGAPTCVASRQQDVPVVIGYLMSGTMVKPLGTTPRLQGSDIAAIDGGTLIRAGDIPLAPAAGEVVCYHAFPLQIFSNSTGWQLTVDRDDEHDFPSIERLYVGSACDAQGVEALWLLHDMQRVTLHHSMQAGACREAVILVAVGLGSHRGGTSAAALRYSLLSADPVSALDTQ